MWICECVHRFRCFLEPDFSANIPLAIQMTRTLCAFWCPWNLSSPGINVSMGNMFYVSQTPSALPGSQTWKLPQSQWLSEECVRRCSSLLCERYRKCVQRPTIHRAGFSLWLSSCMSVSDIIKLENRMYKPPHSSADSLPVAMFPSLSSCSMVGRSYEGEAKPSGYFVPCWQRKPNVISLGIYSGCLCIRVHAGRWGKVVETVDSAATKALPGNTLNPSPNRNLLFFLLLIVICLLNLVFSPFYQRPVPLNKDLSKLIIIIIIKTYTGTIY